MDDEQFLQLLEYAPKPYEREDSTSWVERRVDNLALEVEGIRGDMITTVASIKQEIVSLKIDDADKRTSIIEINDLGSLNLEVIKPIQCILYQKVDDDCFYAESIDFDVYGIGDSVIEAVDDVKEAILVLFDTLIDEIDDNLSDQMVLKKRLLNKHIRMLNEG